jgi:antitoxin (DNA-binding transcriptional repressor) of toxin-antitoxin stability system
MIDNQTYFQTMIQLNFQEAKTHLSRYLADLAPDEVIVLCKRNVPIAEIRPLPPPRREKRRIGVAKGRFTVPPEFFEPLSEGLLDVFEGRES